MNEEITDEYFPCLLILWGTVYLFTEVRLISTWMCFIIIFTGWCMLQYFIYSCESHPIFLLFHRWNKKVFLSLSASQSCDKKKIGRAFLFQPLIKQKNFQCPPLNSGSEINSRATKNRWSSFPLSLSIVGEEGCFFSSCGSQCRWCFNGMRGRRWGSRSGRARAWPRTTGRLKGFSLLYG